MKCYLCNEEITYEDKDFQIVGTETAHISCQQDAEAEARMEVTPRGQND